MKIQDLLDGIIMAAVCTSNKDNMSKVFESLTIEQLNIAEAKINKLRINANDYLRIISKLKNKKNE